MNIDFCTGCGTKTKTNIHGFCRKCTKGSCGQCKSKSDPIEEHRVATLKAAIVNALHHLRYGKIQESVSDSEIFRVADELVQRFYEYEEN